MDMRKLLLELRSYDYVYQWFMVISVIVLLISLWGPKN